MTFKQFTHATSLTCWCWASMLLRNAAGTHAGSRHSGARRPLDGGSRGRARPGCSTEPPACGLGAPRTLRTKPRRLCRENQPAEDRHRLCRGRVCGCTYVRVCMCAGMCVCMFLGLLNSRLSPIRPAAPCPSGCGTGLRARWPVTLFRKSGGWAGGWPVRGGKGVMGGQRAQMS